MWAYLHSYSQDVIDSCNMGYTGACIKLKWEADDLKDSKSSQNFEEKLINILDKSCKKDFESCLTLANIYSERKINLDSKDNIGNVKIKPDSKKAEDYSQKAVPLLETACYYNDNVNACLILSYFNQNAIAVAQNRPKAERLLDLALDISAQKCMLGDLNSCPLIDKYPYYLESISKDIGELPNKCDKGEALACYKVALYYTQQYYTSAHNNSNLSKQEQQKLYDMWDKVDFVKSAEYIKKACSLESKKCKDSIFTIPNAEKCIMKNDIKACDNVKSDKMEFLALACDGGYFSSCYKMRDIPLYDNKKRYVKFLQRLCKIGVIESCTELYEMYSQGNKVSKDLQKATNYAQRACSWSIKNNVESEYCAYAAKGYEEGIYVKQDIPKAIESYKYACASSKDSKDSCARLGDAYVRYNKDSKNALKAYERGCNKENIDIKSCVNLAKEIESSDVLKAMQIYDKIESLGDNKDIYSSLANIYIQEQIYDKSTQKMVENPYLNYAKALKYYRLACKNNEKKYCDISISFTDSNLDSKNPNLIKAQDIILKCKDGEQKYCFQLAQVLELMKDSAYKININNNELNTIMKQDSKNLSFSSMKTIPTDMESLGKSLYISACKSNITQACNRVFSLGLVQDSNDMDLYKSVCLNVNLAEVNMVCQSYGQYAFKNGDYDNTILTLNRFKDSNNENALELLAGANFYDKNYKSVLDIYKSAYKRKVNVDYYYLAKMLEDGIGVRKDSIKAYQLYELMQSPKGYYNVGRMQEFGLGGNEQDIRLARKMYEKACNLNEKVKESQSDEVIQACLRLANISREQHDRKNERLYIKAACDYGYKDADICY